MGLGLTANVDLYGLAGELMAGFRQDVEPRFAGVDGMSEGGRAELFMDVEGARIKFNNLCLVNPLQGIRIAPQAGLVVYVMQCYERILEGNDSNGLAIFEAERALNEAELALMANDKYREARGSL